MTDRIIPEKSAYMKRVRENHAAAAQDVINRIVDAIEANSEVREHINVPAHKGDHRYESEVVSTFHEKGWTVKHFSDQREGEWWEVR